MRTLEIGFLSLVFLVTTGLVIGFMWREQGILRDTLEQQESQINALGTANQSLQTANEELATENQVLREQILSLQDKANPNSNCVPNRLSNAENPAAGTDPWTWLLPAGVVAAALRSLARLAGFGKA